MSWQSQRCAGLHRRDAGRAVMQFPSALLLFPLGISRNVASGVGVRELGTAGGSSKRLPTPKELVACGAAIARATAGWSPSNQGPSPPLGRVGRLLWGLEPSLQKGSEGVFRPAWSSPFGRGSVRPALARQARSPLISPYLRLSWGRCSTSLMIPAYCPGAVWERCDIVASPRCWGLRPARLSRKGRGGSNVSHE